MDGWDLQAVVRGCINDAPDPILGNQRSCCAPLTAVEYDPLSFPEISETKTVLDELEKLYRPFYSALHPVSAQTTFLSSSISVPKEEEPEQKHSIKEPATKQRRRLVIWF